MGESVLRVQFPFHKPCDICHKPSKSLYRIELDGIAVYVCTGSEAVIARDRWMEKKKSGAVPYQKPSEDVPIMEDGNIPEGDEE